MMTAAEDNRDSLSGSESRDSGSGPGMIEDFRVSRKGDGTISRYDPRDDNLLGRVWPFAQGMFKRKVTVAFVRVPFLRAHRESVNLTSFEP